MRHGDASKMQSEHSNIHEQLAIQLPECLNAKRQNHSAAHHSGHCSNDHCSEPEL